MVENLDKQYRDLRQQYSILLSNNQATEASQLRNEIQELRNKIEKILQQNSTTSGSCEEYSPKIDISLMINHFPSNEDTDGNEDGQIYDMVIEDENANDPNDPELDQECVFPFEEDINVDDFTSLPPPTENESEVSQSVVGQTISGVSSYFKSALNYVGLSPTQEGMDEVPIPKPVESSDSLLAEFPVMQTNWYYRQQARILRFYQNFFARVNPSNQEVRATHDYVHISKILKRGNTFTLQFTNSAPEDYTSPNASSIVELFTRLVKNLIVEGN